MAQFFTFLFSTFRQRVCSINGRMAAAPGPSIDTPVAGSVPAVVERSLSLSQVSVVNAPEIDACLPQNWSKTRRWLIVVVLSLMSLMV
jgi:hypothetical protein